MTNVCRVQIGRLIMKARDKVTLPAMERLLVNDKRVFLPSWSSMLQGNSKLFVMEMPIVLSIASAIKALTILEKSTPVFLSKLICKDTARKQFYIKKCTHIIKSFAFGMCIHTDSCIIRKDCMSILQIEAEPILKWKTAR